MNMLLAWFLMLNIGTVLADTLQYDAAGNVLSRTTSQGTTNYAYDALNRLISESGPAKTQSFTYDANGNRLSDGLGSYTYGAASNRMATRHGAAVSYDAAGHMTSDGLGHTFVYNQAGRLYQVLQGSVLLASYYYNYRGLRTRKVTTASAPQGAGTVIYHYDEAGHLIGESAGNGSPIRTYVWRDDVPLAQIDYVPARRVLYFDVDQLNTPRDARDQSGNIVWTWNSDAFGSTAPTGNAVVNLRFPGQYYDQESGLYYNYHRDYDPSSGRYAESDPIGLKGGINTYAYTNQNPLGYVDPLGLSGLVYNNNTGNITIMTGNGLTVGQFPASNNAQRSSQGPIPAGTYPYAYYKPHSESGANGEYGSNGIFVFNVPGRTGVGVHSGRENRCDLAGRCGSNYSTNGCVRTTDQATQLIKSLQQNGDPLTTLKVIR